MEKLLLIRADASVAMGTGHVMRMIALAQAWCKDDGKAVFLCAEITPSLESTVGSEGFGLEKLEVVPGGREDLEATCSAVSRHGGKTSSVAVALDGYQFGSDFQQGVKATGCRLLLVDDYGHADFYHSDLVLNQNLCARASLYARRGDATKLLLGPHYALLRREFSLVRRSAKDIPEKATRLLVTLGGADADNVTKRVIDALAGSGFEMKVAVGGSNPHLASLLEAAKEASRGTTRVDLVFDSREMPQLMAWADFAVAAAGSTCWELAFSGVPFLFFVLADNQAANAREMERRGFGLCLGGYAQFNTQRFRDSVSRIAADRRLRADFASRGRELVDDRGAQRVASLLASDDEISLRRVSEEDFRLIWDWVNDPVTRANSFESAAISWEKHREWCEAKMNNPLCSFWIAANRNLEEVGVVRFDNEDGKATISLSVGPQVRGMGYGAEIIKLACYRLFQSSAVNLVRALIKPSNKASIRAFERAGFRRDVGTMVKGLPAEQYLLHRTS